MTTGPEIDETLPPEAFSDAEMLRRYKALPGLLHRPPDQRGEYIRSGPRAFIVAHLLFRAQLEEFTRGDALAAAPWKQAAQVMRGPTPTILRMGVEYGVDVEYVYVVCEEDWHNSVRCATCWPIR